ncbi:MAG: hypothetical protein PVI91_00100 [Gammaproteobacteria bacterium]|jgi:hypothetical protein
MRTALGGGVGLLLFDIDLIKDPVDSGGKPVGIRRPLSPGSFGIQPGDFYL